MPLSPMLLLLRHFGLASSGLLFTRTLLLGPLVLILGTLRQYNFLLLFTGALWQCKLHGLDPCEPVLPWNSRLPFWYLILSFFFPACFRFANSLMGLRLQRQTSTDRFELQIKQVPLQLVSNSQDQTTWISNSEVNHYLGRKWWGKYVSLKSVLPNSSASLVGWM